MKKIILVVSVLTILFASSITAMAYNNNASYNGGTVNYTCTVLKAAAVGTTGYDNPGYIQVVGVFAYDKKNNLLASQYKESDASATGKAVDKKSRISYAKGTHSILDSSRKVLKTYKGTQTF